MLSRWVFTIAWLTLMLVAFGVLELLQRAGAL